MTSMIKSVLPLGPMVIFTLPVASILIAVWMAMSWPGSTQLIVLVAGTAVSAAE